MTCMRARMSSNFSLIGPQAYNWKNDVHFFSAVLDGILFILAGNDNINESLDEFKIQSDLIRDNRVSCS